MDFKFQVDKLESASIRRRRKRQIQLVLRHRAALEVAICKKIAPSAPPAGSYAESLTKYKEALKAFEKVCSACTLAQLILVSSMNDVNVELMATSKSPPEIWHNFVAVKDTDQWATNGKHDKVCRQATEAFYRFKCGTEITDRH
ncbi:hypothetical protein T06_1340 [Trichinella sp. T6]|nr:hypothetical protein T06_1340 [Trichinella sp. T6]